MDCRRSDALLLELLEENHTITGFLEAIFGFLRRYTDFYHVQTDAKIKLGFPKGTREQLIMSAMRHYAPKHPNRPPANDAANRPPPAAAEVEIETTPMETSVTPPPPPPSPPVAPVAKAPKVPEPLPPFTKTDRKNGAAFENHCWSQTLKELELQVNLPAEYTAKQVQVELKTNSIAVKSRTGQPPRVFLSGEFSERVKPDEVVWTITDSRLLLTVDKTKQSWWEKLFCDDECIDMKAIEVERYIDELPEESQAAIHQMRKDQITVGQHSLQGVSRASADTLRKLEMAWDAEDSPFRGQPFDASKIQIN